MFFARPAFRLSLLLIVLATGFADARRSRPDTSGLISGLGELHHPVSAKNPLAQQFFDQGLKLAYGFNHDEARRSFQRAADLDPQLAMAWWGIALTLGPNYNLPVDLEREKAAYDAIQRAVALQENASEPERAYITALATRYSKDPHPDLRALDLAYKDAMAKLAASYPDDLDAATLFAESMMNLNPWHLWTPDGKPAENTEQILWVLESVLKRDPNHLGANHFYIHAVEASPHPERALPSAARLERLAPAAGHLLHMSSHIYARAGDHTAAARANQLAAAADEKYLRASRATGVYPLMYYSHDLHFLAYAATMRGDFAEAKNAAAKLVAHVAPEVSSMPMLEAFLPTPLVVLLAFERWDDILSSPAPERSLSITNAVFHSLRGIALANLGRAAEAENEQKTFRGLASKVPPDRIYGPLNKAAAVFKIHENLLAAAIARSRNNDNGAIESLKGAVAAEDALSYSEPPAWYPPVRPLLARALLKSNRTMEAEQVLRADLDRNPRNPRGLALLRNCLYAQGRTYESQEIDRQFRAAWVQTEPTRTHQRQRQ